MKGKWEQYKLRENMIDIEFNPPHAYYEMRRLQEWQTRFAAFSEATNNDLMSKTLMMKRLLKWTNEEIRDNLKLRKLEAAHEWEVSQISSNGPLWKQQALQEVVQNQMENAGASAGGGEGGGGDFGGGDFGDDFGDEGGAADIGFSDDDMSDMGDSAGEALDSMGGPMEDE